MKNFCLLLLFSLMMGCATTHASNDREEAYYAELADRHALVDSGKLTELQFAKEAAAIARRHFPEDYRLHALRDFRVFIAGRLDRGEIKRDEFDYLWSEKANAFLADRKEEEARWYANQEQQRQQQNANNAAILRQVGGAFNRTYQQPQPTNCVTVPVGASYTTRCN